MNIDATLQIITLFCCYFDSVLLLYPVLYHPYRTWCVILNL